jgi:hypothetical protein
MYYTRMPMHQKLFVFNPQVFLSEIELQVVFQKFILDHTRIETVPKILGFYPSRDVADLLSAVGTRG